MVETLERNLERTEVVTSAPASLRERTTQAPVKKCEHRNFSTKSLTVNGKINVKIPGREAYEGVDSFSVTYDQPMEVELRGMVYENDEGILEVDYTRFSVKGDRENKAETALDRIGKETVIKLLPDPEITLYRGDERIVLNQVIGIPVINVKSGSMTYSK
jgi:hypothetical protein